MEERLKEFFGREINLEERLYFYDYIENYIKDNVKSWDISPDTDSMAASFAAKISAMPTKDFCFLLSSAGYIPEFYRHDSSQETLYSKLVEVMVCEWAKRAGFIDSSLQKQKSSKEDVTIQLDRTIIVCDAKSFRLGRSQAAPNVKDTIKKADYDKWKESYRKQGTKDERTYNAIGGLITFPTLHRWKGKSDAYLYCTDKDDPICILFYEYLSLYLLLDQGPDKLITLFAIYPDLFPEKSKDQHTYFETIISNLFDIDKGRLTDFIKLSIEIVDEQTNHKLELIDKEIAHLRKKVIDEVNRQEDIEQLKAKLILAETTLISEHLRKQKNNIIKFRVTKGATAARADT